MAGDRSGERRSEGFEMVVVDTFKCYMGLARLLEDFPMLDDTFIDFLG